MKSTLDDIWFDTPVSELSETEVFRRRRRYRASLVAVVGGSYMIDSIFLALFSQTGRVPVAVAFGYACAGFAHVLLFSLLHLSGMSDRARNPHLTEWQMLSGIAIQLTAMFFAPLVKAYFLGVIFVIFSFGTLRITIKSALFMWLLTCVAAGTVLIEFPSILSVATVNPASMQDAVVVGFGFSFLLLRSLLLSYYSTHLRVRMMQHADSLADEVKLVQEIALHDSLTGAFNRHAMLPLLEDQIQLAMRKNTPCVVVMIDIDHFKSVNDNFGHPVGDLVLVHLVSTINAGIRPTDKLSRFGGEEFLLLMPSTNLEEGLDVLERLRNTVEGHDWGASARGLKLTISAGLTDLGAEDSVDTVLRRVDKCLYQAKNSGRNINIAQSVHPDSSGEAGRHDVLLERIP